MTIELYYLQDSRSYVGNDMLWWCATGGYTSDVSKARLFSREKAQTQHDCRPTDIPWPKAYIDGKTRPAVDMQYVRRAEALANTGIVLKKPARIREDVTNCCGCGRFMNDRQRYEGNCVHCGADNRP